jgi:hypothetical protein
MLNRLLSAALAVALLTLPLQAVQAANVDYTDIWYLPSESGWGVNLVQADSVIFATFFVYGPGNVPTWYTAILYSDPNGNFAGNLYAAVGTYFGAPWVPGNLVNTQVGTASFVPSSDYQGTLTYSFTAGGTTVIKSIQRQILTTIALAANYIGGQSGSYYGNGCGAQGGYTDTFNLTVTQPGDGTVSFKFSYLQSQISCTWAGTLVQYGQLYSVPNASYQCSDGTSSTASMDALKATAQGIEATFLAPSGSQGSASCSESAAFSGVLM